jgi:hypothetical protein
MRLALGVFRSRRSWRCRRSPTYFVFALRLGVRSFFVMSERTLPAEFLVISRGQWDSTLSRKERQNVIDQFYAWLEQLVAEGKMKRGQRLAYEGKTIGRQSAITDGPFGESKEVIGGYWSILANNLDEAAQIAKGNPCLDHGLFMEIRPIDPQVATPENTR